MSGVELKLSAAELCIAAAGAFWALTGWAMGTLATGAAGAGRGGATGFAIGGALGRAAEGFRAALGGGAACVLAAN